MRKLTILTLSIIIMLLGCAKKQTITEEPIGEDEILFEEISEDTTEISDITFTEEPEKKEEPSVFEEVEPEVSSEEEIKFEEEPMVGKTEVIKRHGFRVQILASKSRVNANNFAEKARTSLSEDVYVEYIMPYYKVRVGNFTSRAEANIYRRQLINKGYKGAFIVETSIIVE